MHHPYRLLLAAAIFAPAILSQPYTARSPLMFPALECYEVPANLAGTPFAAYVPGEPWAYYSTYSTHPVPQNIDWGLLFGNFFYPGNQVYPGQPVVFGSGYDRAVVPVRLGIQANTDYWKEPPTWALTGNIGTAVSLPASGEISGSAFTFCPTSLIPALPLVASSGTTRQQLLGSLISTPPPQVPVTVDAVATDGDDTYVNGTLANVYYQNGSIYADVTPNVNAQSPISWFPIRVRSGGTVLAFGHLPVLAVDTCGGSITPASAPGALLGTAYSQTFAGAGTAASYNVSLAGALPPGMTFANYQGGNNPGDETPTTAVLSGTPIVAGTYSFTIVATPTTGGCATQQSYTLIVSGPACASDVTSQVGISFGGLKKNLATGQWSETLTLQNTGATAIAGPIDVVLSNLSSNATLVNSSGTTSCFAQGMPYVTYSGSLGAGASATVTLNFTNSQPAVSITFTPRIAAGGNSI